jgi:glycosyltransferase involved in cell wall biosynthesis
MKDELFFSVIIPTYNRADFIRQTVQSVLDQTYRNFEIIIVDDGSTDNTEEVVKGINSNLISYYRIVNSERAVARNFGMEKATGDYITFLDSDDIFYPDYLSNADKALMRFKYPAFFHIAYESKSSSNGKSLYTYSIKNNDIYSLIKGNHLSCLGVFLHREQLKNYRFNEDRDLSGSEDWELWIRIAAKHGIKSSHKVSAALMIHDSRSVLNYDESKLLFRKNLALKYSFEDRAVQRVYGPYRNAMEAYCDTYISLHLALSNNNNKALKYIIMAVKYYPKVLFNKRTAAIFKYVMLNFFRLRSNS